MPVEALIAAYRQALAAEDAGGVRACLEQLEGEAYRNEADWAEIRPFLEAEGLNGRLELITGALIRKGGLATGQPYFVLAGIYVKSGRIELAKPLIAQYRKFKLDSSAPAWLGQTWQFANLLFEAQLYDDCLAEVRAMLTAEPRHFGAHITEARALWGRGDTRLAQKKMKEIKQYLGQDQGGWLWYAAVAHAFGDLNLRDATTRTLIGMIRRGEARLNPSVVTALKQQGFGEDLTELVLAAEPQIYSGAGELAYMFDLARDFGARQTANRFGRAIQAGSNDANLLAKVERFFAEPGFLMA